MKLRILTLLVMVLTLFATTTHAAFWCEETTTTENVEYGVTLEIMKRVCQEKAAVKALDEYRFSLPSGVDYRGRITVDEEASYIPDGCELGFTDSVTVWPGDVSSAIRVESDEKGSMPGYRLVFKYRSYE